MSTSMKSYRIIVASPCDGVGKTSLCGRFATDYFTEAELYDPFQECLTSPSLLYLGISYLSADEYRKRISVDGEEVVLDILDTMSGAGPAALLEEPEIPGIIGVNRNRLLEADGFILVCSIVSSESMYEAMLRLPESIRKTLGSKKDIQFVMVGTKLDREAERGVQKKDIVRKAKGCSYYEVSAKDGVNVNEPFFELVRAIRKSRAPPIVITPPEAAVSRCFPKCCLM